jgi:hypothetical protein
VRIGHVLTSSAMSVRELLRNRLVLTLAALLPLISFAFAVASTGDRVVTIRLAQAPVEALTEAAERDQAILFLAVAAVGLMSAFFGANLVQQRVEVNRRLVLCGYRAAELMAAKLLVLCCITGVVALYTLMLLVPLVGPLRPGGVLLGLCLAAWVYGAYGLLVGSVFRRELETIFAIVLLINLDAGWLQNPVYYLTTRSPWLVESLPGHLPAQTTLLAALTPHPVLRTSVLALLYGAIFLAITVAVYSVRMRVRR